MEIMFVPYRKHTYGPPWPVTGIPLLYYMEMVFVSHRKYTTALYGLLRVYFCLAICLTMLLLPDIRDYGKAERLVSCEMERQCEEEIVA
jgi:hypothetical protein